jgi:hypothetical protein
MLNEVFKDMDESVTLLLSVEDFEDMEVGEEDWEEIRDDTERAELFDYFDDSKFGDTSEMTVENSQNESIGFDNDNVSFVLSTITKDIDCMEYS